MGQLAGAFLSACLTFVVFMDGIRHIDPDYTVPGYNCTNPDVVCTPTAGIFSTYPTDLYPISTLNLFMDQFLGTFILVICVSGITDNRHNSAKGFSFFIKLNVLLYIGVHCISICPEAFVLVF